MVQKETDFFFLLNGNDGIVPLGCGKSCIMDSLQ